MMKIRWLSNGLYSLKNCHKKIEQAFRPPLLDDAQIHTFFLGWGFPNPHIFIFMNDPEWSQMILEQYFPPEGP